jgi:hypothetical protein
MNRTYTIRSTRNYQLFKFSEENREREYNKHQNLKSSVEKYGILWEYPVICRRDTNGNLVVVDGQHRVAYAQAMRCEVYYVVATNDFDVAVVNSASKNWRPENYARRYAMREIASYQEGLAFADKHQIPVGAAFSLLGSTPASIISMKDFREGRFEIGDRAWVDRVISVYSAIANIDERCRKTQFLAACIAACRIKELDIKRLVESAEKYGEKLASYSTKEAYLDMLEELYNHKQRKLLGLKVAARMALRDRSPVSKTARVCLTESQKKSAVAKCAAFFNDFRQPKPSPSKTPWDQPTSK